jgi:RND superfamily putative drug exporter
MAFAVLIDASLVRMILVPAIMSLLGAHAWWLPRWLQPVVPNLQLESAVAVPEPRPAAPPEQVANTEPAPNPEPAQKSDPVANTNPAAKDDPPPC